MQRLNLRRHFLGRHGGTGARAVGSRRQRSRAAALRGGPNAPAPRGNDVHFDAATRKHAGRSSPNVQRLNLHGPSALTDARIVQRLNLSSALRGARDDQVRPASFHSRDAVPAPRRRGCRRVSVAPRNLPPQLVSGRARPSAFAWNRVGGGPEGERPAGPPLAAFHDAGTPDSSQCSAVDMISTTPSGCCRSAAGRCTSFFSLGLRPRPPLAAQAPGAETQQNVDSISRTVH
jgi:hypothetical protein